MNTGLIGFYTVSVKCICSINPHSCMAGYIDTQAFYLLTKKWSSTFMQGSLLTEFENPTSLKNDSEYKKKKERIFSSLAALGKICREAQITCVGERKQKGRSMEKKCPSVNSHQYKDSSREGDKNNSSFRLLLLGQKLQWPGSLVVLGMY